MPISPTVLSDLKQRVDLLRLIPGDFKQIARCQGGEYAGPCPFCGGEDRLHIQPHSPRGGRWFCRQCTGDPHQHGWQDAIDFVMRKEKLGFVEAVTRLNQEVGEYNFAIHRQRRMSIPGWQTAIWQSKVKEVVAQASDRLLNQPDGADARSYLSQRGIEPSSWQAWHLGVDSVWHPQRKQLLPAILLPWCEGSLIQAVQHRFLDPTLSKRERYAQRAGGERRLFGVHLLQGHSTLVLVEGELNAISLWQVRQEMDTDVLSWGAQSNLLSATVTPLAAQIANGYPRLVLWADEFAIAARSLLALHEAGLTVIHVILITSPNGHDANDLLQAGTLNTFLTTHIPVTNPSS